MRGWWPSWSGPRTRRSAEQTPAGSAARVPADYMLPSGRVAAGAAADPERQGRPGRTACPGDRRPTPPVRRAARRRRSRCVLCGLFGELLGATPAWTTDFFAAGGHSLLATRLVARIRSAARGGVAAAAACSSRRRREASPRRCPPTPAPQRKGRRPAVPGRPVRVQRAVESRPAHGAAVAGPAAALVPGPAAAGQLRLQPGLGLQPARRPDLPASQAALDALVARHASLRTRFEDRRRRSRAARE